MADQRTPEPGKHAPTGGVPTSELAGFGVQFVVAIVLFLYVGQWLDRRFGTAPWLMLVGICVGAGGSFYAMFRKVTAQSKQLGRRPPPAP